MHDVERLFGVKRPRHGARDAEPAQIRDKPSDASTSIAPRPLPLGHDDERRRLDWMFGRPPSQRVGMFGADEHDTVGKLRDRAHESPPGAGLGTSPWLAGIRVDQNARTRGMIIGDVIIGASHTSLIMPRQPRRGQRARGVVTAPPTAPQTLGIPSSATGAGNQYVEYVA